MPMSTHDIQSLFPTNAEEAHRLATAQPLRSLTIDGVDYEIGILSDEQAADLTAWGEKIISGTMTAEDHEEPLRAVRELFLAGDPLCDWKTLRAKLRPEHVFAVLRENMRQAAVRAFRCAGSA